LFSVPLPLEFEDELIDMNPLPGKTAKEGESTGQLLEQPGLTLAPKDYARLVVGKVQAATTVVNHVV
jgi:hypothetical protein